MFLFHNKFPEILAAETFSDWVEIEEVTRLDSAICNSLDRSSFLEDQLKQLEVFKCLKDLPVATVKRLSENCVNLVHLECVTHSCDGYLHELLAKNPKITALNIRAKTQLCDSFFTSVAAKLPFLTRLLVRVDCECDLLSSAHHIRSQAKIFSPSVDWVYITPHMSYKRHGGAVKLYSCSCIHDAVVEFFRLTADMFRSVEMMDVCVADAVLQAIGAYHAARLEGMSLTQTQSSFTVQGMRELLKVCTRLYYLQLSGEHKSMIGDDFSDMFVEKNHVTQLILSGNNVITNEAVTRLMDSNKQLSTLNCLHCRYLSYDELMFHKYQNGLKVQVFVHEF
eukprot:gene26912-33560_t